MRLLSIMPMNVPSTLVATLLLTCLGTTSVAYAQNQSQSQGQRIQSPAHQVALVELYTAEGCSSCPPADHWMSGLKTDKRLWTTLVPVAFHVDYWDYIGWPDRFASAEYSNRHHDYHRHAGLRSVYTPGFLVRGEEWRGWFRYPTLNLDKPQAAGVITIDIAPDNNQINARYDAKSSQDLEMHIAVLGFDMKTDVRAGENDGRVLQHDFVVLGYQRAAMKGNESHHLATTSMPEVSENPQRRALAAWVTRLGHPAPIQAAGDWLAN
jgi:hypothetical protein